MNKPNKHNKELLTVLILSAIYGLSVLVTGQACAMTYYQPQVPSKLYKIMEKGDTK